MGAAVPALELAKLREEVWRLRGRRSRATGTILFFLGALLIALGFLTGFGAFEATAILSLSIGAVLMYTSAEPYVKMRVANSVGISSFKAFAQLLQLESSSVKPVFWFNKETSRFSITLQENTTPTLHHVSPSTDKERSIPVSGELLLENIRKELDASDTFQLEQILTLLPRTLVYGVGLCERIEVRRQADSIEVKMWDMSFKHFCMDQEVRSLCCRFGCPINSSIASIIALYSTDPIVAEGCTYISQQRITLLRYRILKPESLDLPPAKVP